MNDSSGFCLKAYVQHYLNVLAPSLSLWATYCGTLCSLPWKRFHFPGYLHRTRNSISESYPAFKVWPKWKLTCTESVLVCQVCTVATAIPRTAHGIPIAALIPPAAVEAAGVSMLRAVAVTSHATLLIIAARIHLQKEKVIYMSKIRVTTWRNAWSLAECLPAPAWLCKMCTS